MPGLLGPRSPTSFNPELARERWRHFATSPPTRGGAGTLIFLAKAAGWKRPSTSRNNGSRSEARWANAQTDRSDHSQGSEGDDTDEDQNWPEPVDFIADPDLTGTPTLHPNHLPDAISPFVFDAAERMGVDPATVALALSVSLAGVMSEEWQIQPKAHDDDG